VLPKPSQLRTRDRTSLRECSAMRPQPYGHRV
jgi:hypothetical protein